MTEHTGQGSRREHSGAQREHAVVQRKNKSGGKIRTGLKTLFSGGVGYYAEEGLHQKQGALVDWTRIKFPIKDGDILFWHDISQNVDFRLSALAGLIAGAAIYLKMRKR